MVAVPPCCWSSSWRACRKKIKLVVLYDYINNMLSFCIFILQLNWFLKHLCICDALSSYSNVSLLSLTKINFTGTYTTGTWISRFTKKFVKTLFCNNGRRSGFVLNSVSFLFYSTVHSILYILCDMIVYHIYRYYSSPTEYIQREYTTYSGER